jgi:hypothetical protein
LFFPAELRRAAYRFQGNFPHPDADDDFLNPMNMMRNATTKAIIASFM